jgi:hypothetical protein
VHRLSDRCREAHGDRRRDGVLVRDDQAFTAADVTLLLAVNVTVHALGGVFGLRVHVAGFGMRPSPSVGTVPIAPTATTM